MSSERTHVLLLWDGGVHNVPWTVGGRHSSALLSGHLSACSVDTDRTAEVPAVIVGLLFQLSLLSFFASCILKVSC